MDKSPDDRLEQWKAGFNKRLEELLKTSSIPEPKQRDLTDIKLINAEDEMAELQEKVQEYKDEHKNNIFHDIQDAQEKLVLRLDSIEVSGSPDYQKRRSNLYTDNQKLSNELSAKFKDHPSNCKDCVQVKVVEVRLDK